MEIAKLKHTYDDLLGVANEGHFRSPSDKEWPAERILAHVIVVNRLLAAASSELLAGRTPVLDNHPAQSAAYLDAIYSAAGSWAELVREVDRSSREVLALAAQLGDEHLAAAIPANLVDGGKVVVDGPVPFGRILGAGHAGGHAEQLRSLTP
jgi:DinB superfamily